MRVQNKLNYDVQIRLMRFAGGSDETAGFGKLSARKTPPKMKETTKYI